MEFRLLPSLVVSWFLLPRPRLDDKFFAGGINFASQVSLELFRAPNPRNAGMGSVMIVIAGSGETSSLFAKDPFWIPMVSPTPGRYVLARCRL